MITLPREGEYGILLLVSRTFRIEGSRRLHIICGVEDISGLLRWRMVPEPSQPSEEAHAVVRLVHL